MLTTDKSGIVAFLNAAVREGMRHVVCSPGSRNAPLVIAIDNHPDIETIVIHDERVAGFYALGMAQQLKTPVGVVCTSGSALLNYYPAVAEAFYQCIPLVVLSADRPQEWINHGDGQTIVQTGVYDNHIRYADSIPEFAEETDAINRRVEAAFDLSNGNWKGPIHFNFPVAEPLYNQVEVEYSSQKQRSPQSDEQWDMNPEFLETWKRSKKKMILCGQLDPNPALLNRLVELSDDSSVLVMVENTSNLQHRRFVHCIDRTLSAIQQSEIEDFQPDVLVTIGGAIVSKRIKQFLREARIVEHCKVGFEFPEMNTYRALTRVAKCAPTTFVGRLLAAEIQRNNSTFGARWKQRDFEYEALTNDYVRLAPFADLTVFDRVLDFIPEGSVLHMGNSSVVRYCQLFNPVPSMIYHSNRGTSGIDGSTSTACGAALINKKCNVLITGDVSFFYDSNALWSNHLPANLRIILINNSGGGIFRIIDGPSSAPQLEKYFEAQHNFKAEKICEAFNVGYCSADSLESIDDLMAEFYAESDNGRPKLLEIFTPTEINPKVLKDFFQLAK